MLRLWFGMSCCTTLQTLYLQRLPLYVGMCRSRCRPLPHFGSLCFSLGRRADAPSVLLGQLLEGVLEEALLCPLSVGWVLLGVRLLDEFLLDALRAERVHLVVEGGRLGDVWPSDPPVAVAAQAREGAESARELDVEGDVRHGDGFDLAKLGQRSLSAVRWVLLVGDVEAHVVLAHERLDHGGLGVLGVYLEDLHSQGGEGAGEGVEHHRGGRRLGVAALAVGVQEVVGRDVSGFLAVLGVVEAEGVGSLCS